MTALDEALDGARRHARSAALRNLGLTSCPYPAAGTPVQSAARRTWVRSYLHVRPPAPGTVGYDSDIDYLADHPDGDVVDQGDDAGELLEEADGAPQVPNVLYDLRTLEAEGSHTGAELKNYWVHGKGAAKVRWGEAGDFLRCVRHLGKYVTDPKGLCNTYHVAALGVAPGKE